MSKRMLFCYIELMNCAFYIELQIGDEFDYLKSDLAMQCLYGGVSYGPQGIHADSIGLS